MKKEHLIIILALSVIVVVYLFVTQNRQIKNYPPKNDTIVAFGDSLVEGFGATEGNDFVSLLSKKLNKPIINLGRSGDTTEDGLVRIKQVTVHNPGTIIVLLGGNDYLRNMSEEQTFKNLRTIILKLQSDGAFIILLGVRGGILKDHFENSFEELAKETGVVYVPNVLDGVWGFPQYMSDIIHPNDAGYAKMADKVYDKIKNYIF